MSKILYLRQHYHFGPARIAAYLSRHGLSVAQSSVHRILGKHGVNRLPANQKHRPHAKRWKRYEKAQPGHRLQLDVKFLERIPGTQKRIYQFTAIDDCTRLRILKVYDACNQRTAVRFIDEVLRRLPFRVLAFAGQCGSERSMGFALIGNAVNLAARLMQSGKRQVLCDAATRAAARRRVVFEALPPLSVKGRNQAVAVFTPLAERQRAGSRRSIGRRREWKVLSEELALLESGGSGNVVLLEGEPGIGKSRLVADLLQQTQASSVRSLKGAGDSIEKSTAYYPWKEVLGRVLHLETLTDTAARQGQIREIFGDKSDHERYMSLLNSVFSVDFPENETTRGMSGEGRFNALLDLLIQMFGSAIAGTPTLLVLEDAHWFDTSSWMLARAVKNRVHPLLLVITTRPLVRKDLSREARLLLNEVELRLRLGTLNAEDTLTLKRIS